MRQGRRHRKSAHGITWASAKRNQVFAKGYVVTLHQCRPQRIDGKADTCALAEQGTDIETYAQLSHPKAQARPAWP